MSYVLQNSLIFAKLLVIFIVPYHFYGDQSPTAVGEDRPDIMAFFTPFHLTICYIDCLLRERAVRLVVFPCWQSRRVARSMSKWEDEKLKRDEYSPAEHSGREFLCQSLTWCKTYKAG